MWTHDEKTVRVSGSAAKREPADARPTLERKAKFASCFEGPPISEAIWWWQHCIYLLCPWAHEPHAMRCNRMLSPVTHAHR